MSSLENGLPRKLPFFRVNPLPNEFPRSSLDGHLRGNLSTKFPHINLLNSRFPRLLDGGWTREGKKAVLGVYGWGSSRNRGNLPLPAKKQSQVLPTTAGLCSTRKLLGPLTRHQALGAVHMGGIAARPVACPTFVPLMSHAASCVIRLVYCLFNNLAQGRLNHA